MPTLGEQVDDIQERMWKLPTASGGYATIELWEPIPLPHGSVPDPLAIARRVYDTGQVTSVAGHKVGAWHKAVRRHFRAHTIDREPARRDADYLSDKLISLLTETLGKPRTVATVEFKPSQWYAAVWEDWLLVTETQAAVLHLGWDS